MCRCIATSQLHSSLGCGAHVGINCQALGFCRHYTAFSRCHSEHLYIFFSFAVVYFICQWSQLAFVTGGCNMLQLHIWTQWPGVTRVMHPLMKRAWFQIHNWMTRVRNCLYLHPHHLSTNESIYSSMLTGASYQQDHRPSCTINDKGQGSRRKERVERGFLRHGSPSWPQFQSGRPHTHLTTSLTTFQIHNLGRKVSLAGWSGFAISERESHKSGWVRKRRTDSNAYCKIILLNLRQSLISAHFWLLPHPGGLNHSVWGYRKS